MPTYDVEIKKFPAVRVASLWAKGLPFNVTVPKAYEELAAWMAEKKIPPLSGSPMGLALYYDDPGAVAPEEVRFKVAIPVPPEAPSIAEGRAAVELLPEAEVAYLTVRGPYTNLEEAYNQLFGWVFQNGRQPTDAAREVYVRWGDEMPPEEWVTEIQVPVGRERGRASFQAVWSPRKISKCGSATPLEDVLYTNFPIKGKVLDMGYGRYSIYSVFAHSVPKTSYNPVLLL